VTDFQWLPDAADPWALMSVSDDSETTYEDGTPGDGSVQVRARERMARGWWHSRMGAPARGVPPDWACAAPVLR
jgi:hypothetical protein